jgi:hypothetical protein|tara:strand:+ start:406 stop:597 length:192 start_codon:yes stop_codon:yes gene_type:complete
VPSGLIATVYPLCEELSFNEAPTYVRPELVAAAIGENRRINRVAERITRPLIPLTQDDEVHVL